MTLLARPAMAIVVTTTLQGSKKSSSSTTLNGIFFSVPTTGNCAAGPTIPNSRSTPNVWNFRATWSRSGSVGDDNEEFRERSLARSASMVSVLPVPVGIAIVAGSVVVVQCTIAA